MTFRLYTILFLCICICSGVFYLLVSGKMKNDVETPSSILTPALSALSSLPEHDIISQIQDNQTKDQKQEELERTNEKVETYIEGIYNTVIIQDIEERQARNRCTCWKRCFFYCRFYFSYTTL